MTRSLETMTRTWDPSTSHEAAQSISPEDLNDLEDRILFTLVGTVTGIEYTMVAQGLPGRLTGRAATCLNLLIFLGAFAVQAGFGLVLDGWHPNLRGQYPAQAYQAGFALLIALQVPGLAWYGWRRWRRPARSGRMDHHPATSTR